MNSIVVWLPFSYLSSTKVPDGVGGGYLGRGKIEEFGENAVSAYAPQLPCRVTSYHFNALKCISNYSLELSLSIYGQF